MAGQNNDCRWMFVAEAANRACAAGDGTGTLPERLFLRVLRDSTFFAAGGAFRPGPIDGRQAEKLKAEK
jgi:hypothetical protein